MKNIVKKILLSAIAILLVSGTFLLEEKVSQAREDLAAPNFVVVEKGNDAKVSEQAERGTAQSVSHLIASGASNRLVAVISENAVLRFAPGSSAKLELKEIDETGRRNILTLQEGRIWLNTLSSSLSMTIKTPVITVEAEPGIFDLSFRDHVMVLTSHRRSALIQFLGNELVLPEGRTIELVDTKIQNAADTIAKLRYSKLIKEFPYFAAEKPDDWVTKNATDDEIFAKAYERKRLNTIREAGPRFGSDETSIFSRLSEFMKQSNITLTFDPAKKEKRELDLIFSYFDAAAYHTLVGNEGAVSKWLATFRERSKLIQKQPQFQMELEKRRDEFAFNGPDDEFFALKIALRDVKNLALIDQLHSAFEDALDAAAAGADVETKARVLKLLRHFGALTDASVRRVRGPEAPHGLLAQYLRYQDFLRQHPDFLREEFLKISELYELAHLNLLETKEEADDERQFFINGKLQAIAMMRDFMEKQTIVFQDGRRSILLLANEIEQLKPAFSDTAVTTYFEDQLKELGPFLAFLRSSRAENLHGSFEKDFQDFRTNLEDLQKVTELLGAATGGIQISAFRREELAGTVATDLGNVDVSEIKIILPEGEDDPRVKIVSAVFEGKTFSATYDTARKVLSEIVFDGEKIPNAVRLENLSKFFLFKMGKFVLPTGIAPETLTEAVSEESLLEKVAKATLLEELSKLNITVEEKYLGMENLNEGVIHVRLALLGQGADAKVFSFDVSQKASVVSQLKVQTVSGEIPVNDEFGLRELPTKVEQIYQRAAFEKQKEEELKKMIE